MSENISAEAIREIERLVKASVEPKFVRPPGYPDHVLAHVGRDGIVQLLPVEPKPLAVVAATPAEFVRFVRDHSGADSEVYYSHKGMVFVRDPQTRRDRATCALPLTEPFRWLLEQSPKPMDPKGFVRLMRVTLAECFSDADRAKLAPIRTLKWESKSTAEVGVQKGRESMSRSILNEVNGVADLPETVALGVRVFDNMPQSVVVRCDLDIDPTEQAIRLTPLPGELHDAIETALDAVETLLRADGMPNAYRGEP